MTHPSEPAASPALTDRAYWRGYWRAKTEQLVAEVPRSLLFHDVFAALLAQAAPRSAIELGGFPGRYSVYLARYFDLDVTLLDFFVDRELLGQIERANGLVQWVRATVTGTLGLQEVAPVSMIRPPGGPAEELIVTTRRHAVGHRRDFAPCQVASYHTESKSSIPMRGNR